MLLYYIRHGDPIYEPDSLTELGHLQSRALAKRLEGSGLDEIYSSPSVRARQTAAPTCEMLGKEPVILDFCCESLAWKDYTAEYEPGKLTWGFYHSPTREKFNSPEVIALGDLWYTHPYFEKTRFEAGVKRIDQKTDEFLASLGYIHDRTGHKYICAKPNEKRVALFAHQGFGMAFLSSLLDIPYNEYCLRFDLGHTGMTVIEFSPYGESCVPKVLQHSNDSHLYKEGLGTKYQNVLQI